jgi:hypothetical protein
MDSAHAPSYQAAPPLYDPAEASRHCELLGLDLPGTHLRAIHWNAPAMKEEQRPAIHLPPGNPWRQSLNGLQRMGYRLYVVPGNGRKDDHVAQLHHCWAEWDDLEPADALAWLHELQVQGLPEPTLLLSTWTRGSIHAWWRLEHPCTDRDRWRRVMDRLVLCLGSDPTCTNPSRVMRLAGSAYIAAESKHPGKGGQVLGQARILDAETTEATTTLEALEAWAEGWLADHPELAAAERETSETTFEPPTEEEREERCRANGHDLLPPCPPEVIQAALDAIPQRVSGTGGPYAHPYHRFVLCGLRDAFYRHYRAEGLEVAEAKARAGQEALQRMEEHSPSRESGWNVAQQLRSSAWLDEGCLWKRARAEGYQPPEEFEELAPAELETPTSTSTPPPSPTRNSRKGRGHGEGTREAIAALQQAMANGLGEVELQGLIQELSERHDTSPLSLQRVAQAERDRLGASVEMEAARKAIEAERDRQELAANLRLCDLLPTRAAKAAEALTRYLPADPLASTLLVLGGFSGVLRLGSRINAYPATNFVEPLCLFAGIVATSGQKKSPLFRALVRNPVRQVVQEIRAAYRQELEKWEALNSKQAESGSPPIPKPREGRAVTTGYTTEALMGQLAANEQNALGLLVAMDELDGLFASENAYRGGRGADEQILLETYDGNGQEILRVRDDVERRFERCHVSIVGGIQPEVLSARVSEGDPRGKWARFCWAPIPRRVCPLPPCDGDGGFQAAAEELAAVYLQGHRISPETYRLDPTGRERFRAYEEQCQRDALDAPTGAVRALRSKAAGKVARIAGVLHVLAIACDEAFGPVVDAALIDQAILLVDFLDGWAAGIHQRTAGGDGSTADGLMRKVHQLSSASRAPITSREVWHRLSKAQRKATDCALIETAMAQLAHLGVGEVTVSERGAHAYRATGGLPQ